MASHIIEPERRTVHGHFSKELSPILEIDSGDTVRFRTLEAGWSLEPPLGLERTRRPILSRGSRARTMGTAYVGRSRSKGRSRG
jgi:hypothetical protein